MMLRRKIVGASVGWVLLLFVQAADARIPRMNLFTPYDILLAPSFSADWCWFLSATLEHAFKERSYQYDENERGNSNCFRKRADVLQLFQNEQDALAALKGGDPSDYLSKLGQTFNLNDDNETHDLFIPCGTLRADNLLLSAWWSWSPDWAFSLHLPVVFMTLKDVAWLPASSTTLQTFESDFGIDVLQQIQQSGAQSLSGWQRAGLGDLTAQLSWEHSFPQSRPFLKNVLLFARLGAIFPTSKRPDYQLLFGTALGNDSGVGMLVALNLDLNVGKHLHLGVDAEITTLWGTCRMRPIRTNEAQTDLLFLQQAYTLSDPGFTQHFTLYAGGVEFWRGLSVKLAYQYTKRQEDRLYLGSFHYSSFIMNGAESLQEWTAHDLIGVISYNFNEATDDALTPSLSLFLKHGFNGQRAVLFDSVALQASLAF